MNEKIYLKIVCGLGMLLLASMTIACQKETSLNESSMDAGLQIHLISLNQITKAIQAGQETDILNAPQYIITDDQISTYDWTQQMIVFDDTVLNLYVNDINYLGNMSTFAIVWNGEVVAQGKITDLGSPLLAEYPVMHVLEPVGNTQFPPSSYRLLSSFHPDAAKIQDLSILLRAEQVNSSETNEIKPIFDDSVVQEIKEYFRQDGRLID